MAKHKGKITRLEIIQCASQLFLEQGFAATTASQIAQSLDIATGNLTYYFPTKEHLLSVLVDMLCDYQWKSMQQAADGGNDPLMAICIELTAMAAMCETDAVAREFYLSAYSSPICLDIIRKNDVRRNMKVFRSHCPQWTDEQFHEAERLVSGMEFGMLMDVGEPVPLQNRIRSAIDAVLKIYNVPEARRCELIDSVLQMDCQSVGAQVLAGFKQYVAESNEQALEQLIRSWAEYKAKQ